MKNRRIKILSVAFVLCMLCGCGGQSGQSGESTVSQPVLNENGKEEVQICASVFSTLMQEIIADYNNKSDRYEVVPVEFNRESTFDDQRTRLQLDLTNGGGPDLLADTALCEIDMKPYAENGLLLDVTDFIAEQDDFVKNVAEANQLGETIYGVPYTFSVGTLITSPQMATDIQNWTKDYCMATAEEKEISLFVGAPYGWGKEQSGLYVLNVLGVGRGGIQLFVDEEQGISHFDQPEFIQMLEFAKRYWDANPETSDVKRLASGEQFCTSGTIRNFSEFSYYEKLFEGSPVYMGYPSPQGGVSQLSVNSFYINAASVHKEGAKDFLCYLLSDQVQRKMVSGIGGGFPVKQKLLEDFWKEAQVKVLDNAEGYEIGGVFYAPELMTQEEERSFWALLENSVYYQWTNDIWDIVWDEAQPFFFGEKTAQEVADVIDNRVQLYLDETK